MSGSFNAALVRGAYESALGRDADPAGLAAATAALDNGESIKQLQAALATSPEGQAALQNLYQQVLGRPIDAAALANSTAAVANFLSLASLRQELAFSPESRADINAIYQSVLGRPADLVGLAGSEAALANGETQPQLRTGIAYSSEAESNLYTAYENIIGSIPVPSTITTDEQDLASGQSLAGVQTFLANSPTAQSNLASIYETVLGRAPDPAGDAFWTQDLAKGGSLNQVQAALVNSQELTNDVTAAYQAGVGHGPDAVQLAAARSEFSFSATQPNGTFATLQAELGELAGGAPPQLPQIQGGAPESPGPLVNAFIYVTPQTIAGPSGPSFVYGLNNDDALISPNQFNGVDITYPSPADPIAATTISSFDKLTDVFEIQSKWNASFASLHIAASPQNPQETVITLGGSGGQIDVPVAPTALTAANFKFV